jgi:hypothetical protein
MTVLPLLILAACAAHAGQLEPFEAGRFDALTKQGRTVVLQFHSDQCAVCIPQQAALQRLAEEPGDLTPAFLTAPFGVDDGLCRRYAATSAGTLLVFKTGALVGRSGALYNDTDIRRFLEDTRMRARAMPGPRPRRAITFGR